MSVTELPDGISIRDGEPADYESVAEMQYPSWRLSYRGILAPAMLDLFDYQKWVSQEYPHRLHRAGWTMRLAESDGQLIGMSIFGPEPGNPHHLEIDSLYIAAGHERRGIGGLMLEDALRSQPLDDVVLWCAEKNFRARRFYQKKGFRLDGRTMMWKLAPGVIEIPQLGYTLYRSAGES